jgi:hypothetical protein
MFNLLIKVTHSYKKIKKVIMRLNWVLKESRDRRNRVRLILIYFIFLRKFYGVVNVIFSCHRAIVHLKNPRVCYIFRVE